MQKRTNRLFDSDMAEERHQASFKNGGVRFESKEEDNVRVSQLTVISQEGAQAIGRDVGRYITISFLSDSHIPFEKAKAEIKHALRSLLPQRPSKILAVGLGNRRLTADSIGVRAAEQIVSTTSAKGGLGVFIPRTFGETGIESAEMIRCAVKAFKPDAMIVMDALAASDSARLLRAVELCDTGISPGTGIGKKSIPISSETMEVPTVALGIPTVMRAQSFLRSVSEEGRDISLRGKEDLLVIPSALDEKIRGIALLIGDAINSFFEE